MTLISNCCTGRSDVACPQSPFMSHFVECPLARDHKQTYNRHISGRATSSSWGLRWDLSLFLVNWSQHVFLDLQISVTYYKDVF